MGSQDFDKEFFQRTWGPEGYYEVFTYGVGFDYVVQKCLVPFFNLEHNALEIGSGGGVFTKKMVNRFRSVIAVDVIKMPEQFEKYSADKFGYYEQSDRCFTLPYKDNIFDFAFSYNCFCHLSNTALIEYIASINRVLKHGGNFIFMLSNAANYDTKGYKLGDLLPFGHFCQDERTLPLIIGDGWEVVSTNMIPEHRDIIVHLKAK